MDALDAILSARDLVAVLGRQVPVRLVEISTVGMSAGEFESAGQGHDRFAAGDVRRRALPGRHPDHALPGVRGLE